MLGITEPEKVEDTTEQTTITIASIKYIDIDGNTYIYLIDTENNIFKAKASDNENMLLLKDGDKVELNHSDSKIISCVKIEE